MLVQGVIKREASPFSNPMIAVKKKDGSVRVCLDARELNKRMVAECDAPVSPDLLLHRLREE